MFNNIGIPGLLLIAVVVLVLFGRGKVSSLMGEVGKGINAFKRGVKEEDEESEQRKVEEARDVTPPGRGDPASPLPRETADEVLKKRPADDDTRV